MGDIRFRVHPDGRWAFHAGTYPFWTVVDPDGAFGANLPDGAMDRLQGWAPAVLVDQATAEAMNELGRAAAIVAGHPVRPDGSVDAPPPGVLADQITAAFDRLTAERDNAFEAFGAFRDRWAALTVMRRRVLDAIAHADEQLLARRDRHPVGSREALALEDGARAVRSIRAAVDGEPAAEAAAQPDPLSVECPTCRVRSGERCGGVADDPPTEAVTSDVDPAVIAAAQRLREDVGQAIEVCYGELGDKGDTAEEVEDVERAIAADMLLVLNWLCPAPAATSQAADPPTEAVTSDG